MVKNNLLSNEIGLSCVLISPLIIDFSIKLKISFSQKEKDLCIVEIFVCHLGEDIKAH